MNTEVQILLDRIEVKVGRTINLGNYESMRVDCTLSASLRDKDGQPLTNQRGCLAEAHERLTKECNLKLDEQVDLSLRALQKKVNQERFEEMLEETGLSEDDVREILQGRL
jgi:hypothetical protein